MNKTIIAAIAVVLILLTAGAYVALSMNTPNDKGNDNGNDNGNNDDNNNDNGNGDNNGGDNNTDPGDNTPPKTIDLGYRTLNIPDWVDPGTSQPKVDLTVTYEGQDEEDKTYLRGEAIQFQITSAPVSGYNGDVLIRVFAELTDPNDEIDPQNLIVDTTARTLNWTSYTRTGPQTNYVVISGDLCAFRTNGNATDVRTFNVTLNYVGNFTLTFQAFDLNTTDALSEPTVAGPLYVPIAGELEFKVIGAGWETNSNGTFFVVLINITNNWNIRHTVYANDLYLSNLTDTVQVNTTATSFNSQQLIPLGGTTQFQAWFDITGDREDFTLQYRDSENGDIYDIDIPLPPGSPD